MAKGAATWKRVKFGEITQCVNDRVDDPKSAGVDRYVGLEHLDPESLTIRRWGTPDDVESTKLRFKPGDVIFGKRRAYQRKLAIADFEGICSAHAMVLRAKPDAVVPEFLPFFMQSDLFMERAIAISVGSLSPTINWKTLAAEEFALPPLEEQRRLVAVLASSRALFDSLTATYSASVSLLESVLQAEVGSISTFAPLQTACRPIVRGIDSPGPDTPGGVPYVRIAEMTGSDEIVVERLLRTSREKADAQPESRLEAGDMVVALRGVVGLPVWVPLSAAGANLSRGTARVSVEEAHNGRFIYWVLKSPSVKREVLRICTGWKGEDLREITLGALRSLMIPLPPRSIQDAVTDRIQAIALSQKSLAARNGRAQTMHKLLLDSLHSRCEQ